MAYDGTAHVRREDATTGTLVAVNKETPRVRGQDGHAGRREWVLRTAPRARGNLRCRAPC